MVITRSIVNYPVTPQGNKHQKGGAMLGNLGGGGGEPLRKEGPDTIKDTL